MTGYRTWSTGDTVTAADFSSYIATQVLTVHASTTARDTAIASPSEGMFAFTTDSDTLWYYDGSAWVATSLAADITDVLTPSNGSLAGGGSSGSISLTVDVNNSTSATAVATDYVLIEDVDDSSATRKALVSDIVSLAPQGDLTGLTAGSLVDITDDTGPVPTINVDLSEASTSTSNDDGDYFLVTDAANAQYKLTKANINLSEMNNDAGWTTAAGTITSVTGSAPIASSGGTTPAISIDTQDAQVVLTSQIFGS